MPMLQRLAWLALQVPIIGAVLWVDFDAGQRGLRAATPGLALLVGIALAWGATIFASMALDLMRVLRARLGPDLGGASRLPQPLAAPRDGSHRALR